MARYKGQLTFHGASGYLTCDICETRWCDHIQAHMIDNSDAFFIWDKNEEVEYAKHRKLEIPMFPTSGVWETVDLFLDESYPFASRYMVKLGIDLICYINPGEGRNVIRLSLIEWMRSKRDKSVKCEARHHGFSAENQWQKNMQSSRMRPIEEWITFRLGMCLWCTGHDPLASTDDLIPSREGRGAFRESITGSTEYA